MSVGVRAIDVLKGGAYEEKGDNARMTAFAGAFATADLVKTTLGPKGMDKILMSVRGGSDGAVEVTNDGATILKSVHINNPAARLLVNISKAQDEEVGDGTTSVVVLTGELLREAEKLLQTKIHPQTIIAGWRLATEVAHKALCDSTRNNSADAGKFRKDLENIARTTLSSKILSQDREHFAKICVDAVLRCGPKAGVDSVKIIKKLGGTMSESYLDPGFIMEKSFSLVHTDALPRVEKCKILIANTAMDTDKIKIFGGQAKTSSLAVLGEIEQAEREKMAAKCDKIAAFGCNVFCNRQLVYYLPNQLLEDKGIAVIEHCDFEGVEALVKVCGGELTSTFDHPEKAVLGECDLIETIMLGEDTALRFSGCKGMQACTIVLRGSSQHLLEEAERSLHDALCVLVTAVRDSRVVFGGGCSEVLMAKAVDELASRTAGKTALAVEAFARALRQMPTIIADNAGYDSAELVAQLRAAHTQGQTTAGLNMDLGIVGKMDELGITEPFRVKEQVLTSATEAAEMLLRVDDVLRSAPRQRRQQHRH